MTRVRKRIARTKSLTCDDARSAKQDGGGGRCPTIPPGQDFARRVRGYRLIAVVRKISAPPAPDRTGKPPEGMDEEAASVVVRNYGEPAAPIPRDSG
jgi:hypothetical protein